jgi:hypothetical protein
MQTKNAILDSVKSAFNFSVDKFPLSGPDGLRTPAIGLFRDDTGEFIGAGNNTFTRGYTPHTTDDVVALVEAASPLFDDNIEVNCHWNNGHYVTVQPDNGFRRSVYNADDSIWPRLIIRAGYDGRAFSAQMGIFRDACLNLEMPRQVSGIGLTVRHTHSLRSKLDNLINDFQALDKAYDNLFDAFQTMEANKLRVSDFLNSVLGEMPAEKGSKQTRHENRVSDIVTRMMKERVSLGRPDMGNDIATGWELYNAVQGYVQHDKPRRGTPSAFDVILRTADDSMVRKAESLALSA